MKRQLFAKGLFLLGILLYSVLCWWKQWDLMTFSVATVLAVILMYCWRRRRWPFILAAGALCGYVAAILTIWTNSWVVLLAHQLGLLAVVGYLLRRGLRFGWCALQLALNSLHLIRWG